MGGEVKIYVLFGHYKQQRKPTLPLSKSEWIPQELVSEETIIKNSFGKYLSYGLWVEKHFLKDTLMVPLRNKK